MKGIAEMNGPAGALDGVVVVDLSRVLAGPWATQGLPPPFLGEHTEQVLSGRLGLSKSKTRQLSDRGIIGVANSAASASTAVAPSLCDHPLRPEPE